ncbi:MAG: hypothetical protein KIT31_24090, partial [Deltaproteobacteria bacterium]|nr:hypothetical protein [Deltaproteobacteria bacterium]
PLVFVLALPVDVARAYRPYRTRVRKTFGRVLLAREHDIYLRGSIPADAVTAPGVDYFVEVSTPRGFSGLAVGSPSAPIQVEVAAPPLADALDRRAGRTTVAFAAEYLDFAMLDRRAGDRRDMMYSGTVDVAYRLDTTVQRVGIGYGVAGGAGGFRDRVWDDATPLPKAGFHYGRAFVELGSRDGVLGGGLIAGVGKDGFGLGAEGTARVGRWDGTNLGITGRILPELGWSTDVRFGAQPANHLLLGVSVGATTQPNDGSTAAKLATELIWIGYENLSLFARASWQGRSIDHGGLGGAAGVGVTW